MPFFAFACRSAFLHCASTTLEASKPSQKPSKYNDHNARNRNQDEKWQQRQQPSKFWISEPGRSNMKFASEAHQVLAPARNLSEN